MVTGTFDRWQTARYNAYRWRAELSVVKKVALAVGMACLTGLLAQVRVALPFTPVPITGQTFAVLLAGILLGKSWGGLSQAIYVVLGVAGVPWFNGWVGGASHLAGPTGGYLIGFIAAALFIGYFTDRYLKSRKLPNLFALLVMANFILIYVPGLLQLNLWLNLVKGQGVGISRTLTMGFTPFIIGDIVKIIAATAIGWSLIPKQPYGNEAERP